MIKLNETPVRTARNFNINNIELENVEIPENLKPFENVNINIESSKDIVTKQNNDIKITYGLGEFFYKQVTENSNYGLKIDINSKMKNLIEVDFEFDENNANLVENILVNAKENTKSNIIIKYKSVNDFEFYHNGIVKVNAKENAEVNIILVNLLNTNSNNFMMVENEILEKL